MFEIKGVFINGFKVRDEYEFECHPLVKRIIKYSEELGIEWKTSCGVYGFIIGGESPELASVTFQHFPEFLENHLINDECEVEAFLYVDGNIDKHVSRKVKRKNRVKIVDLHEKQIV